MDSPNIKDFGGLLVLILVMATLSFIPARTLDYWQAWGYAACQTIVRHRLIPFVSVGTVSVTFSGENA